MKKEYKINNCTVKSKVFKMFTFKTQCLHLMFNK